MDTAFMGLTSSDGVTVDRKLSERPSPLQPFSPPCDHSPGQALRADRVTTRRPIRAGRTLPDAALVIHCHHDVNARDSRAHTGNGQRDQRTAAHSSDPGNGRPTGPCCLFGRQDRVGVLTVVVPAVATGGRRRYWPRRREPGAGGRHLVQADEHTVGDVIHPFNETGLACLVPRWAGCRLRQLTDGDADLVIATATARLVELGQPFTRWSLRKLIAYLCKVHGPGDPHRP